MIGDFDNSQDISFDLNEDETEKINYMEKIKPYIKPAIKIIVIILILFIVYYFIWGNKVDVTILLKKDGKNYDSSINIFSADGQKLITSGNTGDAISLKKNTTYSIQPTNIPANYYLPSQNSILSLGKDDTTLEYVIIPTWAGNIKSIDAIIPETVYKGQYLEIPVTINFDNTSSISIEIIGTDSFKELSQTIDLKNGSNTYKIYFTVPVSDSKELKGKICIANAEKCIKSTINAKIESAPNIRFDLKTSMPLKISAGSTFTINFNIDNKKNKTELKDINLEILNISGLPSGISKENFLEWIEFIPPQNVLAGSSNGPAIIRGTIPLILANSEITFNVKLTNSFLDITSDTITLKINEPNIEINEEIDFGNVLAGETKSANINIANNSDYTLDDVLVTLENHTTSQNLLNEFKLWFDLDKSNSFSIPSKATEQIRVSFFPAKTAITDSFNLVARIKSKYQEWTIPIKGTIKGINVELLWNLSKEYSVPKSNSLGKIYEPIIEIITLKNEGDVTINIQNIVVDTTCSSQYGVKLNEKSLNYNIEAQKEQQISLNITPTIPGLMDTTCTLTTTYTDPRTEEIKTFDEKFIINMPEVTS